MTTPGPVQSTAMIASKILAANWKAHGRSEMLRQWCANAPASTNMVEVIFCPPTAYLAAIGNHTQRFSLGAQNVSAYEEGARTGETTAGMLSDLGCNSVIIGHSERRTLFGEQNAALASKVDQALSAELNIIFCIGENAQQRTQKQTLPVLQKQLAFLVHKVGQYANQLTIAYEPLWAIGTGTAAQPAQVYETHRALRAWLLRSCGEQALRIPLLYGGSVNGDNATALLANHEVNGLLVGSASLNMDTFRRIYHACITATSGMDLKTT